MSEEGKFKVRRRPYTKKLGEIYMQAIWLVTSLGNGKSHVFISAI